GGPRNFYLNDTGLAATTAVPTANTTGNAPVAGSLAVGTPTPTNRLTVNTATTSDSLPQVLASTGAAPNKRLVIQGVSGQTANLQEWQDSSGVVRASMDYNGSVFTLLGGDTVNAATFTTVSGQPLVINKGNGIKLIGNTITLSSSAQYF